MFYVFNSNGVFQSAHMIMRDAHNECFNHVGYYYTTRHDATNMEHDQIKQYEERCKQEADKAAEQRILINEHYRTLNIRFTVREREILALGYKRVSITEHNMAVYTFLRFGKRHTVAACTLSQADEIVWNETLAECKRFVS